MKVNAIFESWKFICESKKQIYFAIAIFILFFFIAAIFPAPEIISTQIKTLINTLAENVAGLSLVELIFFIFKNNLTVAIMGIFLGVIFCIMPFMLAVSNGYVFGFVVRTLFEKLGFAEGFISLWRILPHGVFELPAIIISLGIGIRLGILLLGSLNRNSFNNFFKNLKLAFKTTLLIILPLLLIAAIIESMLIVFLG